MRVVFPAAEGPMMARLSPAVREKFTPLLTRRPNRYHAGFHAA
jgi:hypothetical protein